MKTNEQLHTNLKQGSIVTDIMTWYMTVSLVLCGMVFNGRLGSGPLDPGER